MSGALGIDIGGVIVLRVDDGSATSFYGDRFLENAPIEGAFEGIRRLVGERFGDDVYLVSRAREDDAVTGRTLAWLDHYGFFEATGVKREHIRFCLERHEKDAICAAEGIDHFIDDHMDVLRQLDSVPHRFLFRPAAADLAEFAALLHTVTVADSWPELVEAILARESAGAG